MTTFSSNMQLTNQQQKDTLHRFIQSKTVGDVLNKVKPDGHRAILDLALTSTMEEAFDLLLANDILSVPIYHLEANEKKYVAIVSALDLLRLLSTKVSMETLQTNSDTLLMPLSEAIPISEPLTVLKSTDSLDQLLLLFSIDKAHRVLVQHSSSSLALLSQMDLIHFFQANNHHIGSAMLDLSVDKIKSSAIISSVNFKCTAAEAFLKLAADDRISALPIVDDNNELIGEISAQDLRGLNRSRWDSLLKPVVMYLKACHGDLYAPLTCHDRFLLSQIMSAFVLRKTHRLWWMDYETGELKGVITLTDILSTFASMH